MERRGAGAESSSGKGILAILLRFVGGDWLVACDDSAELD